MVFNIALAAFSMLVIAFSTANAQAPTTPTNSSQAIVGKWTGTYGGPRSGTFELVINQNDNRQLTGQIVMLPPVGSGKAMPLKTVTYQGGQLSAVYDDTENGEVSLTGKFSSPALNGTWQLANGQATGNWQVTRAGR